MRVFAHTDRNSSGIRAQMYNCSLGKRNNRLVSLYDSGLPEPLLLAHFLLSEYQCD